MISSSVVTDVKTGLRQLVAKPWISGVIVASLALGIGANSAIFTIAHATLFEQPDYREPEQIVNLWETFQHANGTGWGTLSVPNLEDWREQSQTVESMSAYSFASVNLLEPQAEQSQRLQSLGAEPQLLKLLGVRPQLGRVFNEAESNVVVISHRFWQERLGQSEDVLGSSLRLNEEPHVIVGVMPPGFSFPENQDVPLYTPLEFSESQRSSRGSHQFRVVGRLAPGSTQQDAQVELDSISASLAIAYPDQQEGRGARVETLKEPVLRRSKTAINMLVGAACLVLLITCANVTNLLLTQARRRRKELHIRTALGASRSGLIRQMLVETQVLAVAGAIVGAVLGAALLRALSALKGSNFRIDESLVLDPRIFGFSVLIAVTAAFLCGILPALRWSTPGSNGNLLATRSESKDRFRSALVVSEVALAVVVMISAGLLVRSLTELNKVEAGLEGEALGKFVVALGSERYEDSTAQINYWQSVQRELSALPEVEAVGLISHMPLLEWGSNGNFGIIGETTTDATQSPFAEYRTASASYFATAGIPLLRGAPLPSGLTEDSALKVVVNQSLAKRYFEDRNPIGEVLTWSTDPTDESTWSTIVGVVGDVRMAGLDQDPMPTIYYSSDQAAEAGMNVVLRTRIDFDKAMVAVREQLGQIDPNQAPFAASSFESILSSSTASRRFNTQLLSGFGILALVLAVAGAAGALWYTVSVRQREIAVRVAVGAQRSHIVSSFLTSGGLQAMFGVALGLVGSALVARVLDNQLYGVSRLDPVTYTSVASGILAVALLAAAVPAWRAARAQPGILLRD